MKYFVADRCVWIELEGIAAYRMRQTWIDVTGLPPSLGWNSDLRVYVTQI